MIDTFHCGRLLLGDAELATDIIARFGGTAKASDEKKNSVRLIGYFPGEVLTHQKRQQIVCALTNEGIFGI